MDDKADVIQRCINEDLKYQVESQAARTWDYEARSTGNFSRWIKILEIGTFNLIERVTIKAALHKHRREATKKIICSTLIDGEYTSDKTENYTPEDKEAWQDAMIDELEAGKTENYAPTPRMGDDDDDDEDASRDVNEILKDWNKCK